MSQSWLGSWFSRGTSQKKAAETAKRSVQDLEETSMALNKRLDNLKLEVMKHKREAMQYRKQKNMSRAQQAWNRAKMYEKQVTRTQAYLLNIDQQKFALEDHTTTHVVYSTMRKGTEAMKQVQGTISVDEIGDLAQEIDDQMVDAMHINDALAKPMGDLALEDDAEWEAEMDAFENDEEFAEQTHEELREQMAVEEQLINLPMPPVRKPVELTAKERKARNKAAKQSKKSNSAAHTTTSSIDAKLQQQQQSAPTANGTRSKAKVKMSPEQMRMYEQFRLQRIREQQQQQQQQQQVPPQKKEMTYAQYQQQKQQDEQGDALFLMEGEAL